MRSKIRGPGLDFPTLLFDKLHQRGRNTRGRFGVDEGRWAALGDLLNRNQGYMEEMGLSNEALDAIVRALRAAPGILGAKISGSGLGDCAIGLGEASMEGIPGQPMEVCMSRVGVRIEA